MKQSLIRQLVKGTNRDSHLRLNLWVTALLFGFATIQYLDGSDDAGWWIGVAIVCRMTEVFISPDVDQANLWGAKRGNIIYRIWWSLFGALTPHRSKMSHSLLLGLPCRLTWAFVPFFFIAYGAYEIGWLDSNQIQDAFFLVKENNWYSMVLLGAFISDFFHLVLDDYGLVEIIFGK
jgi:uncharacterized metal-binding protein